MSEWISVKDRVPELNQEVIGWRRGHPVILTYDAEAHFHRTVIRTDGQWWYDGQRVTHWQIPDPPKTGE